MATLQTNLVSYWKLDESSGNAADSKSSNTLTNKNTTTFVTGKINNGANIVRASNQGFTIADNAPLSITGDMSISCWVNYASSVQGHIVTKFGGVGNRSFRLWTGGTTDIQFATSSNGITLHNVVWTVALSTSTFYHLVLVYTSATHLAELFLNGVSQGTQDVTDTSIFDSTAVFGVGTESTLDSFDGKIDEVGIWSRTLTSTEASQLYNGGSGLSYDSFILFSVSDTVSSSDTFSYLIGYTSSVSDTVSSTDTTTNKYGYANESKVSSTWTNQAKT